MLVIIVGILAACGCVLADIPLSLEIEEAFEQFIREHDRNYATERERLGRFEIFKNNVKEAIRRNENINDTVFGITQFMDLTSEEFTSMYGCFNHNNISYDTCKTLTDHDIPTVDAPESFDWREHNAVTRIKYQDFCGSCWAFSTIGNLEGMYAIKNKQLVEFSEQQLVDCDTEDNGCHGGNMAVAFSYLIQAGGAMTESDYLYEAKRKSCRFNNSKVKVEVSECILYNITSQEKLKQLLYQNGPLTIALAAGDNFHAYHRGILPASECPGEKLNHALVLVGYGVENNKKYWIIKNSWGTGFGENGYWRLERGEGTNACGIMNANGTMSAVLR